MGLFSCLLVLPLPRRSGSGGGCPKSQQNFPVSQYGFLICELVKNLYPEKQKGQIDPIEEGQKPAFFMRYTFGGFSCQYSQRLLGVFVCIQYTHLLYT